MSKFSERVGGVPPVSIQFSSINVRLRNAVWNLILQIIHENTLNAIWSVGTRHFRFPQHKLDDMDELDQTDWLWQHVEKFQWHQVYDLLEFVVENSKDLSGGSWTTTEAQDAANAVFAEEVSGYRFIQGVLSPITDKGEIEAIEQASATANALGLEGVRLHLDAALQLLGKKPKPDYRNSIKESISAVEAAAKKISGEHGGGLDAALKELAKHAEIHKGLQSGFLKLYGYTSDEGGIRHAILEEKEIGFDEAKFMLVACSAFVNFLIGKAEACRLLGTKNMTK